MMLTQGGGDMKKEEVPLKQPVIGGTNLLITILHQENLNYQGVVKWLDTGKTLHFRSTLELMNLINEAVSIQTGDSDVSRTWTSQKQIKAI